MVVVIIEILAAIAVPSYKSHIENSTNGVIKVSLKTFENMLYTELETKNFVNFAETAEKLKVNGELSKSIENNTITLTHPKARIMGVLTIINDSLKVTFPAVE